MKGGGALAFFGDLIGLIRSLRLPDPWFQIFWGVMLALSVWVLVHWLRSRRR